MLNYPFFKAQIRLFGIIPSKSSNWPSLKRAEQKRQTNLRQLSRPMFRGKTCGLLVAGRTYLVVTGFTPWVFGGSDLFEQKDVSANLYPCQANLTYYIYIYRGSNSKNENLLNYRSFPRHLFGIFLFEVRIEIHSIQPDGVLDEATESPVATAWEYGWLSSSLSLWVQLWRLSVRAKQGAKRTLGLLWWLKWTVHQNWFQQLWVWSGHLGFSVFLFGEIM